MLTLLFKVCLIANPSSCEQRQLIFSDETVTVTQCSLGIAGQKQIADFMKNRPNKFVARWKCEPAGQMAKA